MKEKDREERETGIKVRIQKKLEIVFIKHYAPNHMLASKDNTR